jgi:hypothetical protein
VSLCLRHADGYAEAVVVNASQGLSFHGMSVPVGLTLPKVGVTGAITAVDFDNDGDVDLIMTRWVLPPSPLSRSGCGASLLTCHHVLSSRVSVKRRACSRRVGSCISRQGVELLWWWCLLRLLLLALWPASLPSVCISPLPSSQP